MAPADPPFAGVAEAAGKCAGGDDDERACRRFRDALVEQVDEHRDGEHRSPASEHADGRADREPEQDREQHALGRRCRVELLDRPALALPHRNATFDHVKGLRGAVALRQAGAHRGALAGAADDAHRPVGIDPARKLSDVVIGLVDRARDVAGVPLGLLADVEHLDRVAVGLPALVELGKGETLGALDVTLLLAPGGHAATQVAGNPGDADRGSELGRPSAVLVVATDEDHVLVHLGQPGELAAEPGAKHRVA